MRLEPSAAASHCDRAANTILRVMNREMTPEQIARLAEVLSEVTTRMDSKAAAPLCSAAAAAVRHALGKNPHDFTAQSLILQLGALARRLEPNEALPMLLNALGRTLESRQASAAANQFSATLLGMETPERKRRLAALAGSATVEAPAGNPLIGIASLLPAIEPLPCRLDTPTLVELLKHPLCVGELRRVVLDQLEICYRRKFMDVWDFVEFARLKHPDLDFSRPPKGLTSAK